MFVLETDVLSATMSATPNPRVAARDLGGFEGYGLTLVNPWEAV